MTYDLDNMSMSHLFLDTLLKHVANVDTIYPKNPEHPVNPVKKHFRRLMTDIVGKLWGFCHTLRHDGIDYGDYIEQLTYLLFLKMIDE